MMSQHSCSALPLSFQQQIDACCQDFERAWKKDSDPPHIETYLVRVAPADQAFLLRELLILEMYYRRNEHGFPLSEAELCELHARLMPAIAEQLKQLRGEQTGRDGGDCLTQSMTRSPSDFEPTVARGPQSSRGSRGLHIRCPHCSNPVELLADTPLESITCQTCGSAFSLVDQGEGTRELPTLKRIGRFDLVARLGLGGFGTVWKARDIELDRTVAVKIPRKGQLAPQEVELFLREARSAAQLRHPNIVPVHEVGRDGGTIFIVSDFVRGVSLSDWLSGSTPQPGEIARLLAITAEALQHAHEKGVVHRDLKPSNILLDEFGQPHVMDFGLAKRETGEIAMTVDGQVLGTPAYMSPEQAAGQNRWIDRRTDIYSLGVMLFRMLTGELPYRGNAQMQIHQRLTEDPPDPLKLNRYLPRDLCTICVKCLERDPNRRFSSAKELAEELWRFVRKEPILSRPISRTERVLRWSKRKPALTAAGLLTLFLAIAGPITAIVIAAQRDRLSKLVVEKDNLIQQFGTNKEKDAEQIQQLRETLDFKEGRANPWNAWPPKAADRPRIVLMHRMSDQADVLSAQWKETNDVEQRLHGHLALAIVYDELKQFDAAEKNYEVASSLLATLVAQDPAARHFKVALADCYGRLARLQIDKDRANATRDLGRRQSINRQLATEDSDQRLRVELIESELDLGGAQGGIAGAQRMLRAQPLSDQFARNLPNDPVKLYELACYLGNREPLLSTRKQKSDAK